MTRFQFSLDKVLDVRWTAEEEAKRHYAAAQQVLSEQEEMLYLLRQEKRTLLEVPERSINRMQVQHWYLMELDRQTSLVEEQLFHSKQAVEQALGEYITAQKERKVLDKLEERQKEEYDMKEKQIEQKMLDEMSTRKLAFHS